MTHTSLKQLHPGNIVQIRFTRLASHSPSRGARAVALAILLTPAIVLAQAVPDAGRILETNRPPALIPQPKGDAKVLPDVAIPRGVQLAGAQRVMVRRFVFSGVSAFPEAVLREQLTAFTGRELTFSELNQASATLTAYYRAQGYFLAVASLPPQELGQGEVRLQVLEGRISQLTMVPDATVRLSPEGARRYLAALVPVGQPVREDALERALLLTQDLPGMSARAELSPGANMGETALAVALAEGPLVNGNIGVDNSSNRYTGRVRVFGGVNLNDPGGSGGQASLLGSTTGSDFNYARAGYVMPLGDHGARVGAAYSRLRYHLGAEFASLDARGDAAIGQVLLTHPLIRTRFVTLQLHGGFDDKRYTNRANGGETSAKLVQALPFGLSYSGQDSLHGAGFTSAVLDLTPGRVDLSANAASLAADAAGVRSDGGFVHANYQLARYERLGAQTTLVASLSGQLASKNLESGEKISLGGPDRVRAYPAGEASGDEGHVLTLEARYDMAPLDTEFSAFFDYGRITLNHTQYAGALAAGGPGNNYSLKGAGLGVTWRPMAKTSIGLHVAGKIGKNPGRNANGNDADGSSSRIRAWFQASTYF